mgnify:CR=1 FL=1
MASGDVDIQRKAMISVLRVLSIQGDKWLKNLSKSAKATATLQQAGIADFLTEDYVRGQKEIKKGQFPQDRFILIRPPAREVSTVCAVSCVWDFETDFPDFGGYLGIWTPNPMPIVEINVEQKRPIVFLGYRFETPDNTGTMHKFFHLQPCRSMDRGRRELPIAVPHHDVMPTIQLSAYEPADLLVNLAISLYGRDYIPDLVVELGKMRHPSAPSEYIERLKSWF